MRLRILLDLTAFLLALVATMAAPTLVAPPTPPTVSAPATFPPITSSTSLLVVSPHPDDESLCCAGVIQRVLKAGGLVSIVWFTSGDGSELDLLVVEKSLFNNPAKFRDLALRRMQESRDAATILGVPPDRLYFLGYPDRGLFPLVTDYYATPYRSKFTDAGAVPYTNALFPGHTYTGENLERDFDSVLERVHPTLVLAPSPRDSHPDHRATGVATIRALSHRNELSRVRYWIVHGPARLGDLSQTPFKLEPGEEERKHLAISAYHTQMDVMSSFLLSFVRTSELYSMNPVPVQ